MNNRKKSIYEYLTSPLWKVLTIVIGGVITTPLLLWYVWNLGGKLLEESQTVWQLIIIIIVSAMLGIYLGWIVNLEITYKLDPNARVTGVPVPIIFEERTPSTDNWICFYNVYGQLLDLIFFFLVAFSVLLFTYTTFGFRWSFYILVLFALFLKALQDRLSKKNT